MIVGFLILSHQNPAQLARLVSILNSIYDHPPIACHHDTSQSAIDTARYSENVAFVTPSNRTGWGKWSVVQSALAALQLLYSRSDPDWFVLLSAADYPIASADHVCSELVSSGADVLIDYREVGMDTETSAQRFGPRNPALGHFEAPGNRAMLRRRYLGAQLWLPMLRLNDPRGPRPGRHTVKLPFDSPNHPFTSSFKCYCGDHWFSASRTAAAALLNPTPQDRRLQKYLRRRASADECYYQSVLCNRPELSVQRDNRQFSEWNGGGAHPATLTTSDLNSMFGSGAHFARKFRHDDPVLDRIDEILLGPGAGRR